MKRNIHISKTTDTRLAALGGSGRAENLRRAVALAEVAEGLAEALDQLMQLEERDRIMPIGREWDKARDSMAKYKEAKQ